MANAINTNYAQLYRSIGQTGKHSQTSKAAAAKDADALSAMLGGDVSVELSSDGLAALANQRKAAANNDLKHSGGAVNASEEKLSAKAQDFLAKLREKYGDYDFIITENMDDPQSLMNQGTKQYSVILTNEELEKMAEDEEYADKVMGDVESAVDKLNGIEEKGALGDGVQFKHIAISFDNDGNMKLFAELERMSEQQQERMEKQKEKRAEDAKEAARKAEKEKPDGKNAAHRHEQAAVQRTMVEASSEDELWEKILGIDWSSIGATRA